MSPYITFKDTNKDGELELFVCQRDFPHFCASLSFTPDLNAICCIPISRYNLWLKDAGTIRGRFYPGYKDLQQQLEAVMIDMAAWFYNNRIAKDQKRYKKWIINP